MRLYKRLRIISIGVWKADLGKYDLIKSYPVLPRKVSEVLKDEGRKLADIAKEENMPSPYILKQLREFKDRLKSGDVRARLEDVSIVGVEWRGKRRKPDRQVIKYMLDGELVETDAYELVDEFLDK